MTADIPMAVVDRAERESLSAATRQMRPRDAATLILLDRDGNEPRILMGRRRRDLAFMPGKYVFPGGRRDRSDGRVPVSGELAIEDMAMLTAGMGASASANRARALAMTAVRETWEEAGLMIGKPGTLRTRDPDWQDFVRAGIVPDLSHIRYLARAVTPPGRTRRFDTRFFAAFRSAVGHEHENGGHAEELEDVCWLTFAEAARAELPLITLRIIEELKSRLAGDPELDRRDIPVPTYKRVGNAMVRYLERAW